MNKKINISGHENNNNFNDKNTNAIFKILDSYSENKKY
jgi:hypothetical protein